MFGDGLMRKGNIFCTIYKIVGRLKMVKHFAVRCFFSTFALMEQNRQSAPKGKIKNIYARGADDGALMGLYFVVLFVFMVLSPSVSFAGLAGMSMILGVPFLLYYFLRRTHRCAHGMTVFSALWMQGITTFACGALIFGFASFVYLKWIDPGFIRSMLEMAVGYYQDLPDSDGQYAMMADDLSIILKNNAVPSAPAIVIAWMWLIVFSGSLLSMLVAAVVKMRKVPSRR